MDTVRTRYVFDLKPCLCCCSKGLADNTVVAKVNDQLWDLDRPFEGDATLKLLNFETDEG